MICDTGMGTALSRVAALLQARFKLRGINRFSVSENEFNPSFVISTGYMEYLRKREQDRGF